MSGESETIALLKEQIRVGDAAFQHHFNELKRYRDVLEWASCNVDSATAPSIKGQVWMVIVNNAVFKAPTLYQALHTAWEKRDE